MQTDFSLDPAIADSSGDTHACSRHTLVAYDRSHPRRDQLERYIRDVFARKHAAHVKSFMPTLLALQGRASRVCGVAGYRLAAAETLFLERYLDCPIEEAIGSATRLTVAREQVVEIGNLASLSCRAACHLVALLPRYLIGHGRQWVVFTATRTVRSILERLHAPLYELATARADRVADLEDDWGKYYQTDPRVMAGYLPDGLRLPTFGSHRPSLDTLGEESRLSGSCDHRVHRTQGSRPVQLRFVVLGSSVT